MTAEDLDAELDAYHEVVGLHFVQSELFVLQ